MNGFIGIMLAIILVTACGDDSLSVKTQKLFLPKDEKELPDSIVYSDSVLTLILAPRDNVFYYKGPLNDRAVVRRVDYKGLRTVLLDVKNKLGDAMLVLIKPHPNATYKNTVDALDEMTVNDIKKYALIDLTENEKKGYSA
ncbi:hypothetical protein [Paraflavitalea speifideaquila]|uniref:hypothetical protein n=1 Tax=Paraflavitalea speifideaquila TaxID=3076558 RepID=UPI0028E5BB06|nr:hypothetical protein [Paraflavitalea speifideiaquila]